MEIEVYYYERPALVDQFIAQSTDRETCGWVIDRDDHPVCRSFIGLEHPEHEKSFEAAAAMFAAATDPMRRLLLVALVSGATIRIRRMLATFRETGKPRVRCFLAWEARNLYDAGLAFGNETRFCRLSEDGVMPHDPHALAIVYEPGPGETTEDIAEAQAPSAPVRRRVLFIVHDTPAGLYTRPLWPVFTELERRGLGFDVMACDPHAEKLLSGNGVPFERLEADISQITESRMRAVAARLHIAQPADLFEFMLNLGLNSTLLRYVLADLDAWRPVAQRGYSDVVYAPDGTPAAYVFDCLRPSGTASHSILAASIAGSYRTVPTYFADHVHCYGTQAARIIKSMFPAVCPVLVGNSSLYRYRGGSPKQGSSILIATSSFDLHEDRWIDALLKDIPASETRILIKPHPMFAQRYEKYLGRLNGHVLVPASDPVEPLVEAADVVVTDHSQVGRDAALLGKPVVSMSIDEEPIYLKGIRSIVFCRDIPSLVQTVRDIVAGHRRPLPDQAFIDDYNWGGDDRYYERVVDFLLAGEAERLRRVASMKEQFEHIEARHG